jgi:hypothetical protein
MSESQERSAALREPTQHELKTWPEFFEPVFQGVKTFELRKDDREYREGDELWLREWQPMKGYTGRDCWRVVTYLKRAEDFHWEAGVLAPGYVLMGIIESKAKREAAASLSPQPAPEWQEALMVLRAIRSDASAYQWHRAVDSIIARSLSLRGNDQ